MVLEADREIRPVGGRKGGERGFSSKQAGGTRQKRARRAQNEDARREGRGRGGREGRAQKQGLSFGGETEVGRGLPRMGGNVEYEAISRESMRDARG